MKDPADRRAEWFHEHLWRIQSHRAPSLGLSTPRRPESAERLLQLLLATKRYNPSGQRRGWRGRRQLRLGRESSRPSEDNTSHWHPFEDDNGVSGHAFMGAIPRLSAAKMTDRPLWKGFFYAGSLLPGLSRITDDAHFPSQVFMGWVIAYVATSAVDQTQQSENNLTVYPWQAAMPRESLW